MAYSDDDDLALFIKNVSSLPDPFTDYHDAAAEEIDRSLLRAGISQDALDDLSDATLADLVGPSVHFALYQFFQGFPSDPDLLDRAKFHLKEHERLLGMVDIVTSSGATEVPSYGSIRLG